MFADYTNLFFNHKDIGHLFKVVNNELVNIKDCFNANKLSLNKKEDIPLHLLKLIINNYQRQSEECIKFIRILLDQHLTWKEHIKLTENKIVKNIGKLYKEIPYLDKRTFLASTTKGDI